ncbi:MAG: phage portal protein [Hyphomonas sp.]|nr:phage portal protein [Hyphomonas sp.]
MRATRRLLGPDGRPLRPSGSLLISSDDYAGASRNRQQTAGWMVSPKPSSAETANARQTIAARTRDLMRNSGVAAGTMRKMRAQQIGPGFRLRAKPDADQLGVDPKEAVLFARQAEASWNRWAFDPKRQCDIARKRTFGQISRTLWSERFQTGENIAVIRWQPDRGTAFATCIQEVDPDRLSNRNDAPDTDYKRQGIEFSETGEPVAYDIRERHQADYVISAKVFEWSTLPRIGEDGRRVVIHAFSADRAEQIRGISPFAPLLAAFRSLDRFAEAELGAAIINATLAGFIKSGYDPGAVAEALGLDQGGMVEAGKSWQDARLAMYGAEGLSIHDNKIPALAPGDEFEVNNTSRQTGAYKDFKKAFLQDFAAAVGLPYMVLSEDWSGASYSSARAALAETWRIVTEDREDFISDTIDPVYYEVMTEAFWRGYLVEPDGWPPFEGNEVAYLNADWTGPGRGYVDPEKEAKANLLLWRMGAKTLDQICAEQGLYWDDVITQVGQELARMRELGVVPPELAEALAMSSPGETEEAQNA